MAELTERIQLTRAHRDLILKLCYVSGRLEASLRRWPKDQMIRRVWMDRVALHWLIGDLSHCCVKGKAGRDVEAVNNLCNHLEHAQQTGDGDLEASW
ncbi:MAG: hypothetical protein R3C59_09675 [Planctomycetaceae bacterium]